MAGLNAIQILRGTSSTLNSSTQTLLPGQLVYNKDKNYLSIGSDIEEGKNSPLNKSPIEVRRLVAYYEDTDNSIGANTTPIFSIGDSSLGGSGHNLTLEYKGTGSDAPDNYVALNDSTFFTNVQRINLTATTVLSINSKAMFVDIDSSSVSMTANRINITGGEPMQSGIGASTIAVGLNARNFGLINLTTTSDKGGTSNEAEAITLQSNMINLKSYTSAGIQIINTSNQVLLTGNNIGFSSGANILAIHPNNTTVGTFKFPTIPESNYNTLYTLATTANIANINDTLQTNTTTIYAPTAEYDPDGTNNAGVAVRVNTSNGFNWEWRQVKDSSESGALSGSPTSTNLVTERDVYHGLPNINGDHLYTSNTNIYAPTSNGATTQFLCGSGSTAVAPKWKTLYYHSIYISLDGQSITLANGKTEQNGQLFVDFSIISSYSTGQTSEHYESISLDGLTQIFGDNFPIDSFIHIPATGHISERETGGWSYPINYIVVNRSNDDSFSMSAYASMWNATSWAYGTVNMDNVLMFHYEFEIL